MSTSFLQSRQTKYGAYITIYILIVLAILGAANFLANRYDKTKDFTSNQLFGLADQSVKIAKNLTTDVKITYFDKNEAWDSSRFGPSPRDLLTRYSNVSPKITVEYVDPTRSPKRALDAKVTSLGTVIVEAAGRREEAKGLGEEQITNAVIRILKPNKHTACFLTGHGEHELENTQENGFAGLKEAIESSNAVTRPISLQEKTAQVPVDCTLLIIGGPKNELADVEIDAIRKYVQGGGRALIMIDPLIKITNTALTKLLEEWSVTVNDDLVVDLSGFGQLYGTDEFAPLVTKYENHPITKEMRNVATLFPLARSISPGTSKPEVTVEKLFGTSSRSFAVKNFKTGKVDIDPKRDTPGPMNLAVAGTYSAPAQSAAADAPKPVSGRFVVVGSSRFATNTALGLPVGNRDLALNMMAWLTNDEDLISIRPKEAEDRRLTMSADQMNRLLFANVFGLPFIIIGAGVWSWWKRR
jgi:ABC-type uncharacterized transport system involved in gliding motility auxiliary subunit